MARAALAEPVCNPAAHRLRVALQEMASDNPSAAPTATALCERAGISRNALYRYHADVLHELHNLQHQRRHHKSSKADKPLQRLRGDSKELHSQISKLAALVDHYFCAWIEARSLLERRERELAELRLHQNSNLHPIQT